MCCTCRSGTARRTNSCTPSSSRAEAAPAASTATAAATASRAQAASAVAVDAALPPPSRGRSSWQSGAHGWRDRREREPVASCVMAPTASQLPMEGTDWVSRKSSGHPLIISRSYRLRASVRLSPAPAPSVAAPSAAAAAAAAAAAHRALLYCIRRQTRRSTFLIRSRNSYTDTVVCVHYSCTSRDGLQNFPSLAGLQGFLQMQAQAHSD